MVFFLKWFLLKKCPYFCIMMNTQINNKWFDDLKKDHPFLIAGPCSAETPEQVLEIAHQIKDVASIFRAGIWKPRTRPGGFEGVGSIGLNWLQRVKEETGLPLAVEIATAEHAQLALSHDIDVLWIGARTSVNPFAVQEIADALKGTDKIVMLKNPVNPDMALWMGGLERLLKADIHKVALIHRGFSTYEKTKYRNVPEWQIPLDIKAQFPDIKLINDPSHITGNRDMILETSQTALDLNFDALMIETHCTPDVAWSDAAQQITPNRLKEIINLLITRDLSNSEESFQISMNNFRNEIDELDTKILKLLNKRMHIADEIGYLKKDKNVAVFQQDRWQQVLNKMRREANDFELGEDFIIALYKAIHQESISRQGNIINKI